MTSFSAVTTGGLDRLQVEYSIESETAEVPAFEIAFFGSFDARFDGTDVELGSRLVIAAAADRGPGQHNVSFSGTSYAAILADLTVPFILAVANPDQAVAESDFANNDRNFIGIFHSAGTRSPLVIRGRDDTDRYQDNANDVITINPSKKGRVQVSTSLAAKPLLLPVTSVSDFRLLTAGGDDSVTGGKRLRVPINADAGSGNDTVMGSATNDMLFGGDGSDLVRGRKGKDLVLGAGANDLIIGSRGADTLMGEEGDDFIAGRKGMDMLCGGPGADVLRGGRGSDTESGGSEGDWLHGGFGLDRLYADTLDHLLESGIILQETGEPICNALLQKGQK
jgi:Ca2+-binding RTX toxin-like protein